MIYPENIPLPPFLKGDEEAVRQPSKAPSCHSEPFGRLRTGSAKREIVILSPALGGTKDLEILRLTPQNDIVGQPLEGDSAALKQPKGP